MKALLISGMQVDLLPGGPAEVPGSQELIGLLNELVQDFPCVVAANFMMPANHLSFAANHPWRRPGQLIQVEGTPTLLTHIYGVPGSFGAEFMPGLDTSRIEFIALMGTNPELAPYSAFFDAGHQRSTGLFDFLSERRVRRLYLAGVPLDAELGNTALDALVTGFETYLISAACKARHPEAIAALQDDLQQKGAVILSA